MSRVSCNIIEDLIPLYAEDLLSEDSKQLVEKHLDVCEECREYLNELREMESLPPETDTNPLKKIQHTIQKKKRHAMLLSILITLFVGALAVIYMTAPNYLPYTEEIVMVNETDNGYTLVDFHEDVARYDIQSNSAESRTGSVYHLTTWSTTWHDWADADEVDPIVLNPSGDQVGAVYYYQADGTEEQLIYGEDLYENGGVVTLPRLSLSYFTIAAVVALLISLSILFIVRSNKVYFDRILRIVFLPLSYLVAQLLVTGWTTTTYSLVRDLSAILLVAIILYGVCWIGIEMIKKRLVE